MGFLSGFQRWRRARKMKALLAAGDVAGARKLVGEDTSFDVEQGRALLGHEGSTLDSLLRATPADPELERLLKEASATQVPTTPRVLSLANALFEHGKSTQATALLERAAHARDDWELLEKALEVLCEAEEWERAWPLVERGLTLTKRNRGGEAHRFLLNVHQLVLSNLEGQEAVTVDLLVRGELDPFSGANHLLLASALMKQGPLTTRLELRSAGDELREGEALLQGDRTSAQGLLRVGSAKLRLGEFAEARDAFERGRDVAPRHFALVAGLGSVRSFETERMLQRVQALPSLPEPRGFVDVLPDVNALTHLERKVAIVGIAPLARWIPALLATTSKLRVLPLDVRVTDLPEFEVLRGRAEERDHRAWDGVGGLAGDGLACVRVEEIFNLAELQWTLAHEFAHLVHDVLPDALRERVHTEWVRACEHEFAFDQYQLSNEFEFFAVTYTRWLTRRYQLPFEHETDEEGHLARALRCIDDVVG